MKTRRIIAIFAALALLGAGYALAEAGQQASGKTADTRDPMGMGQGMMGGGGTRGMMGGGGMMGMMGGQMQGDYQMMMAQVDSLDSRLEEQLAVAKKSRGDAKVDALIGVIEELVAQRRTMRAGMMNMMPQMMGHMMQYTGSQMMGGMQRMRPDTGDDQ